MNSSSQKRIKFTDRPVEIIEQEDRISQLPDELLHYILSFLKILDVVRLTGVLSKRWENLWSTMPFLNFDIDSFREIRPQYLSHHVNKIKDFIYWVLMIQGSSYRLTRFRLCSGNKVDHTTVMRWIRIAASRNVQEVEIICEPSHALFELPYCLSICECFHVLRLNLSKCVLHLPKNVHFRHLKSLEVERVHLTDMFLTQSLFSQFSVLETLSFKNCILHSQVLCIASDSLKDLTIMTCNGFSESKLEVSCPILLSFSYKGPKPNRFSLLGDLSSLEILCLDMYRESGDQLDDQAIECEVLEILKKAVNIRSLSLKTDAMPGFVGEVDRIQGLNTTFQRLKSLTLSIGIDEIYTQPMFLLLKNCPSLEHLTITLVELQDYAQRWNWQLDDELSSWWKYHLKSIQLVNFVDDPNDVDFVKFIMKNGLVLKKFNIIWKDGCIRSDAIEKAVLMAPKASPIVAVRFR